MCVCKLLPEGAAASPICFLDSEGLRLSKNRKSLRKSTEHELHSFAGGSTLGWMGCAVLGRRAGKASFSSELCKHKNASQERAFLILKHPTGAAVKNKKGEGGGEGGLNKTFPVLPFCREDRRGAVGIFGRLGMLGAEENPARCSTGAQNSLFTDQLLSLHSLPQASVHCWFEAGAPAWLVSAACRKDLHRGRV